MALFNARSLFLCLAFAVPAAALAEPVAAPGDIKFPEQAVAPAPVPSGTPFKLLKGQVYVVTSKSPLLVLQRGTGKVSVAVKTTAVTFPAEAVPGWKPDAADPDYVTFAAPFTYVVKPVVTGPVELQLIPALNAMVKDKAGKDVQKPLAEADILYKQIDVDVGQGPQPPPGPTPPSPGPSPTPSDPSPFAAPGLRVLIVYESADIAKMPREQQLILASKDVRDYLNAKCVKNGQQPEWRVYDVSQNLTPDSQLWQDAKLRKRDSLPWALIGNGTNGYDGPLPATAAEFLALVKKFEK